MFNNGKKRKQYKHGLQRGHHQKRCLLLPFLDNLAVVLGPSDITGQNTIYLDCLKISNSFALAAKQGRKACQRLAYLPVSKTRTIKFHT